jgi:AcrR family transcriptional regulator
MVSQLGLAQVTLGALAGRARLSKSGLFAHFGSKDALTAAVLEAAAALGEEEILRPAMAEPEGLPRLIIFMRRWLGWAPRCGLPGGCPFVAAISSWTTLYRRCVACCWIFRRNGTWFLLALWVRPCS